jgi:hypothetical protein
MTFGVARVEVCERRIDVRWLVEERFLDVPVGELDEEQRIHEDRSAGR